LGLKIDIEEYVGMMKTYISVRTVGVMIKRMNTCITVPNPLLVTAELLIRNYRVGL